MIFYLLSNFQHKYKQKRYIYIYLHHSHILISYLQYFLDPFYVNTSGRGDCARAEDHHPDASGAAVPWYPLALGRLTFPMSFDGFCSKLMRKHWV